MINSLHVSDFRVIENISVSFGSSVNFVVGNNGSGKTSLLETIYLCGRGQSFRHKEAGPFIRNGTDRSVVFVELNNNNAITRLGVERTKRAIRAKLNGSNVTKRSILADTLPLQLITSQSQSLLENQPDLRRRFIDMIMFHVEHEYPSLWRSYRQCLRQRNNEVRRKSPSSLSHWDKLLANYGHSIDEFRSTVLSRIISISEDILANWGFSDLVSFSYFRGWPDSTELSDVLKQKVESDLSSGYTLYGPHRCDLKVSANAEKSGKKLSRGQLKIVVFSLYFAFIQYMKNLGRPTPTLLIDDLFAELDSDNISKILTSIKNLELQSVITCIDLKPEYISKEARVFHVEHGTLLSEESV